MDEEEIKAIQEENDNLKKQIQSLSESVSKLEENNKSLVKEKQSAKTAAQKAAEEAARSSGDIDALEKSYIQKIKEIEEKLTSELTTKDMIISQMNSGEAAFKIAEKYAIKGSASVLQKLISGRLKTEIHDNKPVIRVLDNDGNVSSMTIEEYEKEIINNPEYAPLIVGSRANGTGEMSGKSPQGNNQIKRSDFDNFSPIDKMNFIKEKGVIVD